jgi:adenylate cyclase
MEKTKRKLTAILSADVKGYSRLMGEDERTTVETLKTYREVMGKLVRQYQGRVIDSPGDNLLSEFASVVDAVECAVKIQEELKKRNEELPEKRRMEFRIGVHHGDVIEDEERIYGDGVNIAARIEGLAEGGGICISRTSFDSVKNKLSLGYEYLGEHSVKNIAEPVRVYKVLVDPEAAGKVIDEERPKLRQWRWAAIGGVVVLIIVAGAFAIWNFYFRPPPIEPASVEKMAFPLPDKPSIAVLPFDNLSGDPEQEYIADGISENIITALSHISQMFVIARNSSFTYKGKSVKVQQVSEELGVRFVLEGSVLKSGDKVRITAQLIDALTGGHIWSKRFDRDFDDLFALIDEITWAIAVELQVELTEGEMARIITTDNLDAWLYIEKAKKHFSPEKGKEGITKSRTFLKKALEIDPEYAGAVTMLAWTHFIDARYGYTDSRKESFKRAVQLANKSLALDDKQPFVRELFIFLYLFQKQHEKAIEEGRKTLALGPNRASGYIAFCEALYRSGNFEEAVPMCEKAIRLHPHTPIYYLGHMMSAYYWVGRYEESLAMAEQLMDRGKKTKSWGMVWWGNWGAARAHIKLGQEDKAREDVANLLKIRPDYCLDLDRRNALYKPEIIEREHAVMRKAGLPETPPLPLPDKPSIAVLPFVNMSEDPKQEYFSDGITEEIITALSKTPKLFVIARNSTFTYKGKPVRVQQVGRELGVRYVLEGSVRKSEDKVRITAQLVDAQSGNHLWAERYDRELKDIFAVQDDISKKIITALRVELTEGEQARIWAKGTDNLEAYLLCIQGQEQIRRMNKDGTVRSRQMAEKAIALDPNYALAYRLLANTYAMEVPLRLTKNPRQSIARAMELTQKALALDESLASAHSLLGYLYTLMRQHDKGIQECERGVALEPNSALAHFFLNLALRYAGRAKEAITMCKEAIRLDPIPMSGYYQGLTNAYCLTGQYKEAITAGRKAVHIEPNNLIAHVFLAAAYSLHGREEEAHIEAGEVLRINPKFSVDHWEKTIPYRNKADKELIIGALRKAGLK